MSENCTHDCGSCGEECGSRQMNPADFLESGHQSSSSKGVIVFRSGKENFQAVLGYSIPIPS